MLQRQTGWQAQGAFSLRLAWLCKRAEKLFWDTGLVGCGAVWGDNWSFTPLPAGTCAKVGWRQSLGCSHIVPWPCSSHSSPSDASQGFSEWREDCTILALLSMQPGLHGGLGTVPFSAALVVQLLANSSEEQSVLHSPVSVSCPKLFILDLLKGGDFFVCCLLA